MINYLVRSQKEFGKVKLKEKEAQCVFHMETNLQKKSASTLQIADLWVMWNHRFKLGNKLKASGVQTCKAGYKQDLDYYKFDPA